ncbi:zinc finger, CCHC-type containing protein [Tanacetum coccineum]|uniref:Zinc finger, CCHC-type containing protein n=1 Tax=Tanacetum coccineum TaxID=301880 RepID=A0ABQ5EY24_9ASTR
MWGEAILMATYLLNKIPRKEKEETPYELWMGRKPSYQYLRVWGCLAKVAVPPPKAQKIGPKSVDCIFIGLLRKHSAYHFSLFYQGNWESSRLDDKSCPQDKRQEMINDLPKILKTDSGCKPLRYKWIFKKKMKADGTIDKYKARLVIKGFSQHEGLDYVDTYLSVTRITLIRMIIAIAALRNLEIHIMDVKTAFLNGDLEEEIYMNQPEGTRPDLAYAVSRLSRYTSNPSYAHWKAITRVLHYLRYSRDYGLHYDRHPAVIEGYSDANWISDIKDSRSTSGYVFTLGGAAISWKSSKQTVIAKSTMESEFIALDKCGEEAEWLRQFVEDIPRWPKPNSVFDITSIRQLLSTGVISIDYVASKDNIADPFTKGLSRELVSKSSKGMGLKPLKE